MTSDAFPPIADLLRELHRRGVPFVVLRYSPMWSPLEPELDLLVPARTKDAFVRQILAALPPQVAVLGTKSGLTGVRVLTLSLVDETAESAALALDIRELVRKGDALLADYARLTAAGIDEEDGLPVPRAHMQAAFLVARNTWAGRKLSRRHHDILERSWSPRALAALSDLLVLSYGDNYEQVVANAERAPLPRRRQASNPLARARIVVRHGTGRAVLRRGQRPSVLAIHGPDGAGKSTSAALVADRLRASGVRVVAQHYTRGEIDRDYIDRQQAKATRIDKDARPPTTHTGWWARARRLVLFPVRHLQFQIDLLHKRGMDVVVYDRFAFDHLFKERASLAVSPRVRRAVARAARLLHASSRTVNVVLEAAPADIRARKAEMSAEEIAEYYATSKIYFGEDASWVSADRSSSEVADAVASSFVEAIDAKIGHYWRAPRATPPSPPSSTKFPTRSSTA